MADSGRHRSHLKQSNKPFKGRSKSAKEKFGRVLPTASNPSDWVSSSKLARKNSAAQKRKQQRESITRKNRGLDESQQSFPYNVGILAMNGDCDCEALKSQLLGSCENGEIPILPDSNKMQVLFNVIPRNELAVLDWGKVVDCILVVFSCKNVDLSKVKLDPSACNAIDELGYKILSALKTQGFPSIAGVLQHLEEISVKRQKEAKKIYSRYYDSEFPNCAKLTTTVKPVQVLRTLTTALNNAEELAFRSFRSYMQVVSFQTSENISYLTGYIKGSGCLNANQLVHITGLGDFSIHLLRTPNGEYYPDNPESILAEKDPGPFAAEQTWPTDTELAEAFSKLEVKTDHPPNEIDEEEDEELNMSDEEKQVLEFEDRKREDFDFPDEVNTPNDQPARVRFQKYRGLASLRTSEWDPYENLPQSYSKIYEFKEPNHVVKKHELEVVVNTTQTSLGMMITIGIANFPIEKMVNDRPIVLSSLLPHERKLSVLHFKLERWGNLEVKILSKETVTLHYGFRRVHCRPIYSEDSTADKYKYLREFNDSGFVIGSIFAPTCYGPCNVVMYKETMEGGEMVAVGSLHSFDPKRVIIKRILLTGYPLKIHKRKAVVRYMFREPKDIRYFKPIELFTKSGLRGHIKESLGTHGNMKCVFNDFIKHGDIICLPLYKRVFPKWDPEVWSLT